MIHVIRIPQTDGVRLLALDDNDRELVRQDRALVDAVHPLACLDVTRGGQRTWQRLLRGRDTAAGRAAIREHLDSEW